MRIQDSVAFITGANRGLGLAFAKELLGRGVKKVYAGARNPDSIDLPGVVPVKVVTKGLDVKKSDPKKVAARTLGALQNGSEGVLADEQTKALKRNLSTEQAYYLNPSESA